MPLETLLEKAMITTRQAHPGARAAIRTSKWASNRRSLLAGVSSLWGKELSEINFRSEQNGLSCGCFVPAGSWHTCLLVTLPCLGDAYLPEKSWGERAKGHWALQRAQGTSVFWRFSYETHDDGCLPQSPQPLWELKINNTEITWSTVVLQAMLPPVSCVIKWTRPTKKKSALGSLAWKPRFAWGRAAEIHG